MNTTASFVATAALLGLAATAPLRLEAQVDGGQVRAETAGRTLIGMPAPRFVLETINGDTIDLGELFGEKGGVLEILGYLVRALPQADARISRGDLSRGRRRPGRHRSEHGNQRLARSHRASIGARSASRCQSSSTTAGSPRR